MSSQIVGAGTPMDLRLRALSRLNRSSGEGGAGASPPDALRVLFELASSPDTADDALALLHELQVHQVELEIQDEELRSSRAEMDAALSRQIELYDFAPVGCFTVDRSTVLLELNQTGARLLGFERDALLGQALVSFFAPRSADTLHTLLARADAGHQGESCELQLMQLGGAPRIVQAAANMDPAGCGLLVALIEVGGSPSRRSASFLTTA